MKPVLFFYMEGCPYCRQAEKWMNELIAEHPEYKNVEIRRVDERRERDFADTFDYYYVPTYYVDGVKVHEGAATKGKIEAVYQKALQ